MWRRGSMGMLMWQLLSLVVAASCVIVASGLGQGQRVTSVYDFPDGRGFRADLEVIEHTELYGADVNELSMTVRCGLDWNLVLWRVWRNLRSSLIGYVVGCALCRNYCFGVSRLDSVCFISLYCGRYGVELFCSLVCVCSMERIFALSLIAA